MRRQVRTCLVGTTTTSVSSNETTKRRPVHLFCTAPMQSPSLSRGFCPHVYMWVLRICHHTAIVTLSHAESVKSNHHHTSYHTSYHAAIVIVTPPHNSQHISCCHTSRHVAVITELRSKSQLSSHKSQVTMQSSSVITEIIYAFMHQSSSQLSHTSPCSHNYLGAMNRSPRQLLSHQSPCSRRHETLRSSRQVGCFHRSPMQPCSSSRQVNLVTTQSHHSRPVSCRYKSPHNHAAAVAKSVVVSTAAPTTRNIRGHCQATVSCRLRRHLPQLLNLAQPVCH